MSKLHGKHWRPDMLLTGRLGQQSTQSTVILLDEGVQDLLVLITLFQCFLACLQTDKFM